MKELNNKVAVAYCEKKYTQKIKKDLVKVVFECGSRDALDAIRIDKTYSPEEIYIFEPNPEGVRLCKKHLKKYGKPHLKFFDKAVSNVNGEVKFYPTTEENIGASSMFRYNERANGWDGFKKNCFRATQKEEITVQSIRLDSFMKENDINNIDLLCMDVQEAELFVLQGLGDLLKNIKYIILEVSGEGYYQGGSRFADIDKLLKDNGFVLADIESKAKARFGNALYTNSKISEQQ